ncbi:MAG: hypothetical protein IKB64_04155, partial [Paludibacteraceae bacterium]|nr:hypothetical protein [Paludibacteraceae bacterium]
SGKLKTLNMEIKIETKFNLEENVFFIEENKIKHAYIKEINITSRIVRSSFYGFGVGNKILYTLKESGYIKTKYITKVESELFATKEELIEHIKNI